MSDLALTPEQLPELADKIAERMAAERCPVWTRAEIAMFTPYKKPGTITRFLARSKIKPCANGYYSSAKIKQALNQLAKQKYTRIYKKKEAV